MSITVTSDYTGEFHISTQLISLLTPFIEKYEKQYLVQLLGAELYKLYVADPNTSPYSVLTDSFEKEINGDNYISEGIKKMLIAFVYYEFMKDRITNANSSGFTSNANENGDVQVKEKAGQKLYNKYGEGVKTARAIQTYISSVSGTYPLYNGVEFEYKRFYW